MFKTQAGPVEGEGATAYLRPETAQGIFTNFANVLATVRKKPPFGIAQVGKSFRNEITPQNFVFRTREFEQMEMEYFVAPDEADEWYRYWIDDALRLVRRPRHPRGDAAPARARQGGPLALLARARPTSSSSTPGAGTSSRASPTAATTTSPSTRTHSGVALDYFDPVDQRALHALRHRAGRRRDARDDGLSARRLPRGRRRGRDAHACCASTGASRPTRSPCCRCRRSPSSRRVATEVLDDAAAALHVRLRRHPVDRAALPPPGRGRHAVLRHGRLRHARGPRGHGARPRHDRARCASRSTSSLAHLCEPPDRLTMATTGAASFGSVAEHYDRYRPRSARRARPRSSATCAGKRRARSRRGHRQADPLPASRSARTSASSSPTTTMRAVLVRAQPRGRRRCAATAEAVPVADASLRRGRLVVGVALVPATGRERARPGAARRRAPRRAWNGFTRRGVGARPRAPARARRRPVTASRAGGARTCSGAPFVDCEDFDIDWTWPRSVDDVVGNFATYSGSFVPVRRAVALFEEVRRAVSRTAPSTGWSQCP